MGRRKKNLKKKDGDAKEKEKISSIQRMYTLCKRQKTTI